MSSPSFSLWEKLVLRYLPQFVICNDAASDRVEQYLPTSIDWFLQQTPDGTVLANRDGSGKVTQVNAKPDRKVIAEYPTKYDTKAKVGNFLVSSDKSFKGNPEAFTAYAHVRKANINADKNWIDIQYWIFFCYNGLGGNLPGDWKPGSSPIQDGEHEGDWEHVTVRVSNWAKVVNGQWDITQGRVEAVFFAAHTAAEGVWVHADDPRLELLPDSLNLGAPLTHPKSYVAWSTHANYVTPGLHRRWLSKQFLNGWIRFKNWQVGNDYCDANGLLFGWNPYQIGGPLRVECSWVDSDVGKGPQEDWLKFGGLWGRDSTGAPITPSAQGTWITDGINGYFGSLTEVSQIGNNWNESHWCSSVKFGFMAGKQVFACSLGSPDKKDDNRVFVYYNDEKANPSSQLLASAGVGMDKDLSYSCIEFGLVADSLASKTAILVCGLAQSKTNTKHPQTCHIYRYDDTGSLKLIAADQAQVQVGFSTTNKVSCILVPVLNAKGQVIDNITYVAVGMNTPTGSDHQHDGAKCFLYQLVKNSPGSSMEYSLKLIQSFGKSWNSSTWTSGVAFGELANQFVLAISTIRHKGKGTGNRLEIYSITPNNVTLNNPPLIRSLYSYGSDWVPTCWITDVCIGGLPDGTQTLAYCLNTTTDGKPQGSLFFVKTLVEGSDFKYSFTDIMNGPSKWWDDEPCTGISLGILNGSGLVCVSKKNTDDYTCCFFGYSLTGNQTYLTAWQGRNTGWGDDRYATCIANGLYAGKRCVAWGRNKKNNARAAIQTWTMVGTPSPAQPIRSQL